MIHGNKRKVSTTARQAYLLPLTFQCIERIGTDLDALNVVVIKV